MHQNTKYSWNIKICEGFADFSILSKNLLEFIYSAVISINSLSENIAPIYDIFVKGGVPDKYVMETCTRPSAQSQLAIGAGLVF